MADVGSFVTAPIIDINGVPPVVKSARRIVVKVGSSLVTNEGRGLDEAAIAESIERMAADVQAYVPGYRLKQKVQFDVIPEDKPLTIPGHGQFSGLKTSVFLEVEGAAHYLPAYAGNLDIMTSAAMATAERMAQAMAHN